MRSFSKKLSQKIREVVKSFAGISKKEKKPHKKRKEISKGELGLLHFLRKKQGSRIKLPKDIRPNFTERIKPLESNKTETSEEENLDQNFLGESEGTRTPNKAREMNYLDLPEEKTKTLGSRRDKNGSKEQLQEGQKDGDERIDLENRSNGQVESDDSHRENYSDGSDKKIQEKKPPRGKKSVNREEFQPQGYSGCHKEDNSLSNESKTQFNKKSIDETIRDLNFVKKFGLYAEKLHQVSEVYFELEGVEIESEIEDYHMYFNELKPQDMFIDLTENFQEICQELIIDDEEEGRVETQIANPRENDCRLIKTSYYTLEEDLEILAYINSHPKTSAQPTSKEFWEYAIDKLNFLKGTRMPESLCERYQFFLMNLNENNKAEIKAWTFKHGSQGLLIFQQKECEDSSGRRFQVNVMDTIALKYCPAISKRTTDVQEKGREKRHRSKKREIRELTKLERQFQYSLEESEDESTMRSYKSRQDTRNSYSNLSLREFTRSNQNFTKDNDFLKSLKHNSFKALCLSSKRMNSKEEAIKDRFNRNNKCDPLKTGSQKPRHFIVSSGAISKKSALSQDSAIRAEARHQMSIVLEDDEPEEIVYYSRKNKLSQEKTQDFSNQQSQGYSNDQNGYLHMKKAIQRDTEEGEEQILGAHPSKKIKKQADIGSNKIDDTSRDHLQKEIQRIRPDINQLTIQKIIEKANWLKQTSKTYSKSPKEILNAFYSCSMNVQILEQYFKGEQHLLWTKEEDEVLQEGRARVIRILTKYKKTENVTIRQAFLEQFEKLNKLFDTGELILHEAPAIS